MNLFRWHKETTEKLASKIGWYTALWIAFIKGVVLALLLVYFLK